MEVFIDMLNDKRDLQNTKATKCASNPIKGEFYRNAEVERECHHIDILIKGKGHCIIIENKINDARDMDKQMSRYFKEMTDEGFIVDAIVYLTKTPETYPDTSSWSHKEKEECLPLIIIVPANDVAGKISLLNNWIKPCALATGAPHCASSLQQYGALIEYLTPDFMKAAAIKRLLEYLQEHPVDIRNAFIREEIKRELRAEMARQIRESVRELISSKGLSFEGGQWPPNSCVINLDMADDRIWVYCDTDESSAYKLGFRGDWHDFDSAHYHVSWFPKLQTDVEVAVDQNGAYLAKEFNFGKEGIKALLDFISKLLDFADKSKQ